MTASDGQRPAPKSLVIRPEDMLEDASDTVLVNGIEIRKGTLGAFFANANRFMETSSDHPQRPDLAAEISRLAPAVRALGVLNVFTPRSAELAALLADVSGTTAPGV